MTQRGLRPQPKLEQKETKVTKVQQSRDFGNTVWLCGIAPPFVGFCSKSARRAKKQNVSSTDQSEELQRLQLETSF